MHIFVLNLLILFPLYTYDEFIYIKSLSPN